MDCIIGEVNSFSSKCIIYNPGFTFIAGTGASSGVNFAIPIDTVVQYVPILIVYGTPYKDRFLSCLSFVLEKDLGV